MIYFDAAATTLEKPPQVERAVRQAMHRCASPSRGGYAAAMAADETLFSCRQAAAALFDAEAEQVVFTMNATHGLNIAISSLLGPGRRAVISGFEHNAVTRPLAALGAEVTPVGGALFQPLDFDPSGGGAAPALRRGDLHARFQCLRLPAASRRSRGPVPGAARAPGHRCGPIGRLPADFPAKDRGCVHRHARA